MASEPGEPLPGASGPSGDGRLERTARVMQIAMAFSVTVGIFIALYGLYGIKQQAELSLTSLRLTQLDSLKELVAENRKLQETAGEPFLRMLSKPEASTRRTATNLCPGGRLVSADKMLEAYDYEGAAMYQDPCLEHFKDMGSHYEELGTMVRLGYVPFDFLFTLVAFPDRFWRESREYREAIRDNWGGKGKPLEDFWINFSWLRDEYRRERRAQQ